MGFQGGGGAEPDNVSLEENVSGNLAVKPEWQSSDIVLPDSQNTLSIVELQADAAVAPFDYDGVLVDTFSDDTGYNDTVNAGDTDAFFSTNKFSALDGTGTVNTITISPASNPLTDERGEKVTLSAGANHISAATKHAACTATHCYIYNAAYDTQIAKVAFSGNTATFDQDLTASTTYYVVVDSEGGSYNDQSDGAVSYPIVDNSLTWIAGRIGSGDFPGGKFNILTVTTKNITTTPVDVVLDVPASSSTWVYAQLVGEVERESDDTIQFQLFDGSDWTTLADFETLRDLTELSANPTKLKVILTPATAPSAGTAIKAYALKLWD